MSLPSGVDRRERLSPEEVADFRRLVEAAEQADGVGPLSEHVMLHLPVGGDSGVVHLVVRDEAGRLAGYAHLDRTDAVSGSSAEVVVHPRSRRHGVGSRLVSALLAESPDGRLRLWAHGDRPGAEALAARGGFRRGRVLWQMRRPLPGTPLPPPELPPGVSLRAFRPGQDETAWVTLNARAFAGHPEQGDWDVSDLQLREAEPWFDPDGFFLAERGGALVGFHWTKVHGHRHDPADSGGPHDHPALGEVYVVGVDPAEQGSGLGRTLTVVGLRHLDRLGLDSAMLYVDETNAAAIRLYEGLGFTRAGTDVCYVRG